MNKKLFKTLAATAMSVLAIACAKEPVAGVGGETGVSFTLEVPGTPATKAYGEAEKATKLYYQVFDNTGAPIEGLGVQSTDLIGKAAKVSFQLVKDQTYSFVFWAQTAETGYYTIDETEGLKKITANYTGKLANDENFDAFYATEKLTVTGPVAKEVKLTRPFAQINVATEGQISVSDKNGIQAFKDLDFTDATSAVTVKQIPTAFNPLDDTFDANENITFATAAIPTGNITVSAKDYKLLAVNYVFAPKDRTVYDITAEVTLKDKAPVKLSVPAAPAQRNWRTNILGNILTSGADFNVVVEPGFEENGDENIDLNNIKTETELKAALATYGVANIANDVEVESYVSIKKNSLITIESTGSIAPSSDMRKDISEIIYVSGGTLTLDGAGKIIGQSNGTSGYGSEAITVAGGTLNIKGNLTVEAGSGSVKSDRAVYVRKGTLNIYGGYFQTSDDANGNPNPVIFLNPDWGKTANCNIYGGVFESTGKPEYVVNIEDAGRSRANIKIYGGKFKGFDPGNVNEGTITSFLADGYKSTLVGDYYVVTKEDVTPVVDQAGLEAALASLSGTNDATLELGAGEYEFTKANYKGHITIKGAGTDVTKLASNKAYFDNKEITFEDLTFNCNNVWVEDARVSQFPRTDVTYKNCVLNGTVGLIINQSAKFYDCTFNVDSKEKYCIEYYGNTKSKAVFDNCKFNTHGKCILIYNEAANVFEVNVDNCKFNASETVSGKTAIQMHTEYGISGVLTVNNTTATGFDSAINGGLWNDINNSTKVPTKKFTVTVDGTTVQTAE